MGLTKEQAILRLKGIHTPEQLRQLIKEIDTSGTGKTTVLWSGAAGFHGSGNTKVLKAQDIALSLFAENPDFRIVANTEAAKFLDTDRNSVNYNRAFTQKLQELFSNNPDKINEFLIGKIDKKTEKRISKGIWDDVSEKFVKEAKGEVRLLVGGGGFDRVFAQTEMRALLDNPAVTSIEGVSIGRLRLLAKQKDITYALRIVMAASEATTGMIKIEVDAKGNPIAAMDGSYRIDASDYVNKNTLFSSIPKGMRPMTEFIPVERRLRHIQAVEEIHRLNPDLKRYGLSFSPDSDLFQKNLGFSRIASIADKVTNVSSVGFMLHKAGTELQAGNHRAAHNTVASWALESAGSFLAGRAASLLAAPLMATGPLGMLLGVGIIIGASILGGELAKKLLKEQQEQFKEYVELIIYMVSPLVLDLDGNGIQTLALADQYIHFDHDNNGFPERTGWVEANDGLLVLDLNGNGKIDGGGELFGNQTRLDNGPLAANGFLALAIYDSNLDGRIDSIDPIWTQLRVWKDQNSNGKSDPDELLSMAECEIQALLLQYTTNTEVDANGNTHKEHGFFERLNGELSALTDVWFSQDHLDSLPPPLKEVTADIAALPDIPGMGIVPSLHQAMMNPKQPKLKETLLKWLRSNRVQRMALSPELLFQWCDANHNPFSNPNREMNSDDRAMKRKIAVVEKFMGQMMPNTVDFIGINRLNAIDAMNKELSFNLDMILNLEITLRPLFQLAIPVETDLHGPLQMDLTDSVAHLRSQWQRDPDPAFILMVQWQLAKFGDSGLAFFQALKTTALQTPDALAFAMGVYQPISEPWNWLTGSTKSEEIKGTETNDFIESGAEIDFLYGRAGDDTLHGGPENDFYIGGKGGDTYYISQNGTNASDYISDQGDETSTRPDRIIFWEVASNNVRPVITGKDVSFYSPDKIHIARITGQMEPENRIEEFHFADGVCWTYNTLMLQMPIQGTAGNDKLTGTSDMSNRLHGLLGNDTLIGGTMPDHLEGQAGNDWLMGLAGSDTLIGGPGNDTLEGGENGDKYYFSANSGHDRISDINRLSSDSDRVVFSNLSTSSLTRVLRIGQSLQLQFGSSASLTLVNQLQPLSCIESFAFANGPVWDHATLLRQVQ